MKKRGIEMLEGEEQATITDYWYIPAAANVRGEASGSKEVKIINLLGDMK